MEKKICKIDLSTIRAGLTHQTQNFKNIIKFCLKHNLQLIKPNFRLFGLHNNGNELLSDLSRYYDLENIICNGKKFKMIEDTGIPFTITKKYYKWDLLRLDPLFSNLPNIFITIPYNKIIHNIANKINNSLGENLLCIHVRRGDKLLEPANMLPNGNLDYDTQPKNIMSIINKCPCNNIYIMTNKIDEIIELKKYSKDIYFYSDFNLLKENSKDNYFLYCIESIIMKNAKYRCSTFKTNNNYYQYNLSNLSGYQ